MIVEIAPRLIERLRIATDQDYAERQSKEITETRSALTQLTSHYDTFEGLYHALFSRMTPEEIEQFRPQIKRIRSVMESQRDNLGKDRRSVIRVLNDAIREIQQLTVSLEQYWMELVKSTCEPHRRMMDILSKMDELKPILASSAMLLANLENTSRSIPRSAENVDAFFTKINTLGMQMNTVPGLSSDVRTFLERSSRGTATLADMTDEVLEWCRQHPSHFVVTLI